MEVNQNPEAVQQAEPTPPPPIRSASSAAIEVSSKESKGWILGVCGGSLALAGTVVQIATASMVSKQGGSAMVSALSATNASLGFVAMLFNFVFLGGISLIGAAVGEGDPFKAGRFARLTVVIAFTAGLVATGVLIPCRTYILDIYGQDDVTEEAEPLFLILAAAFSLDVLNKALGGIMLGFMYAHILVMCSFFSVAVTIGLGLPLFLNTDLGLKAFGIAGAAGEVTQILAVSLFLLQRSQRERYGLVLSVSDITSSDVRTYLGSVGLLAYRSLLVETPYLITMILAIRLGTVQGAIFQFLHLQSKLVDNIVSGFAMAMNFMGSRLWAGGYHGAFWNLLFFFLFFLCTPLTVVFTSIALANGRGRLAELFAADDEKDDFDSVITGGVFAVYILVIVARGYYNMIEQTLIAMQEYKRLAVILSVSFLAYLAIALAGYFSNDFGILYLGTFVFYLCRIAGSGRVIKQLMRAHGLERFVKHTRSDPEHALKLTIDDPVVAKIFGGREKVAGRKTSLVEEQAHSPTDPQQIGKTLENV